MILMSLLQQLTNQAVQNNPITINHWGVILGLGTALISLFSTLGIPMIRGYYKRKSERKNSEAEIYLEEHKKKFQLSDTEFRKIEKHAVFRILENLELEFKNIYENSNKRLPQKLFIYQMNETFDYLKKEMERSVSLINKHKHSNREDVSSQISKSVITAKIGLNCYMNNLGLSKDLLRIYNVWFEHHWRWYTNKMNECILLQDSYYDMVNVHLIRTWTFIDAVLEDVTSTIDDYNGDVERILNDKEKNFDFAKYDYLN